MINQRTYKFTFEIKEKALKSLQALPKHQFKQIGHAMDSLQQNFSGDIKKLKGYEDRYRLRVGDVRVLFKLVKTHITVYLIAYRKDAYGN